jgi:hypothetical protein
MAKHVNKVAPVRRFETHKDTPQGKRQTMERKQVRALKYGSAK